VKDFIFPSKLVTGTVATKAMAQETPAFTTTELSQPTARSIKGNYSQNPIPAPYPQHQGHAMALPTTPSSPYTSIAQERSSPWDSPAPTIDGTASFAFPTEPLTLLTTQLGVNDEFLPYMGSDASFPHLQTAPVTAGSDDPPRGSTPRGNSCAASAPPTQCWDCHNRNASGSLWTHPHYQLTFYTSRSSGPWHDKRLLLAAYQHIVSLRAQPWILPSFHMLGIAPDRQGLRNNNPNRAFK
jgi:hypothetical protein